MNPLVLQLIQMFAPIIVDVINQYRAAHNGDMPTDEQVKTELAANIALYLGEGSAWKAAHPDV